MSSSSHPTRRSFRVSVLSASNVVLLWALLLFKPAVCAPAAQHSSSVIATTTVPSPSSSRHILLFEDSEFKGIRSRLIVGPSSCVNLIGKLNDFVSSVDTMSGCYLLCEHKHCRGKCEEVNGKVPHLSRLGLNDRVSSIRDCGGKPLQRRDGDKENHSDRLATNTLIKITISDSPASTVLLKRRRYKRSVRWKQEQDTVSVFSTLRPPTGRTRTRQRPRRTEYPYDHTNRSRNITMIETAHHPTSRTRYTPSSMENGRDSNLFPGGRGAKVDPPGGTLHPHQRLATIKRRRKRRGSILSKESNKTGQNIINLQKQ